MKAYTSCVQELHPPFSGVGAASGDCYAIALGSRSATTSSSTRKIVSRPHTKPKYFTVADLTGKRFVVASVHAAVPFLCWPSHHHFKHKVVYPASRNWCLCSPSDADNLGLCNSEDINSNVDSDSEPLSQVQSEGNGIGIQITKIGKRSRRIVSNIRINASLPIIWDVLTDYERLDEFIPGLVLSRLLEKRDNFVRLFQIGQQNLALGLKFNAKAVLDCYEKDLENLSFGRRRDIEFKMVEGDFENFEGKWSIEQHEASQALDLLDGQECHSILSYVVEVKPKLWLPVRLVEGRLCSEIQTNLSCVRKEVHIRSQSSCS